MNITIGIIGTGLSGSLTAINLLKKSGTPLHIILFEKDAKRYARGVAYSNDFIYQPLNVTTEGMSLFKEQPLHFFNWVTERKNDYSIPEDFNPQSFISRKIFGDYLTYTLEQTIQHNPLHSVTLVYDEVKELKKKKNQVTLTTLRNEEFKCSKVILALGNFPPAPLPVLKREFMKHDGYEANPWREGLIESIEINEEVMFVGSGLTMIDLLINLKQKGHTGKIYILSRKGLLPQLHQSYQAETINWNYEELHGGLENLFLSIKEKTIAFRSQSKDWRNVIDSLRPHAPSIWKSFSSKDRNIFFKKLRSFWEVHRHRVPQHSMELLNGYFLNNEATLFSGRLEEIKLEENNFFVTFTDKKDKQKKSVSVNRIINCTGPDSNYKNLDNSLLYDMLMKGYVMQDSSQLGLVTNDEGALVDIQNNPSENIFTLGPARKGTEWESTALREIRLQSETVAANIIRQLKSKNVTAN